MKISASKALLLGICVLFAYWLLSTSSLAENMPTDIQFDTVISDAPTQSTVLADYDDQKSVNFSGRLTGTGMVQPDRIFQYAEGEFLLDFRYPKGMKAFIDLSLLHAATPLPGDPPIDTAVTVKEFFIDYQWNRQLYIRSGKQFATWGRTYFWNPVDFVNRDKKSFLDLTAFRSGVVGTRFDIPLSSDQNFYFFIDQDGATTPKELAFVSKLDFTWSSWALGISMWNRYHAMTQYGFDCSTSLSGWNINSEIALSFGSNTPKLIFLSSGPATTTITDQWIARSSVSVMRQWHWDRPNRVTSIIELFYNGDGYNTNVLSDPTTAAFLNNNGLIARHSFSRWYTGYFLTFSEFPSHDQSIALNNITNWVDQSFITSIQVSHQFSTDFSIRLLLAALSGASDTEYGSSGARLQAQIQTQLQF